MADECIFCKIASGTIPSHRVHDDPHTVGFLDIRPLTKGHSLVIPRRHATRLEDLSVEEAKAVMAAVHALTPRLLRAVGAPAATIALHNGPESGQEVAHLHAHVIPRAQGDGGGPVHSAFTKRPNVSAEELTALARTVRA